MSIKELLYPRDKVFFTLLERESKNVLRGARAFQELITHYENVAEKRNGIKAIEHDGDDIVHEIYLRLAKSFITPIDREDIAKLASLYDDVLDYIYAVVNRLFLYEIQAPTDVMRRFTEIIMSSVEEIDVAFASFHEITAPGIEERCNEVDRLENEADILLNESVANLFKTPDAITIMKLKEIYELMELVTDRCEDVVLVIRGIILEYS